MIEKHIADLTTHDGFVKQYNLFVAEYNNHKEAYEATERLYKSNFGKNKYSDYHSFKNTRNEKIRNSKKKAKK